MHIAQIAGLRQIGGGDFDDSSIYDQQVYGFLIGSDTTSNFHSDLVRFLKF